MHTTKLSLKGIATTTVSTNIETVKPSPRNLLKECKALAEMIEDSLANNQREWEQLGGIRRRRYSRRTSFEEEHRNDKAKERRLREEIALLREDIHMSMKDLKSNQQYRQFFDIDVQASVKLELEKRDDLVVQYNHTVKENMSIRRKLAQMDEQQRHLEKELDNSVIQHLNFVEVSTNRQKLGNLEHVAKQLKNEIATSQLHYSHHYKQQIAEFKAIELTLEEQDIYLKRMLSMRDRQRAFINELLSQIDFQQLVTNRPKQHRRYRTPPRPNRKYDMAIESEVQSRSLTMHSANNDPAIISYRSANAGGKLPAMKIRVPISSRQSEPHHSKHEQIKQTPESKSATPVAQPKGRQKTKPTQKQLTKSSRSSSSEDPQEDLRLFKPVTIEKEIIVLPKPPVPDEDSSSSDSDIFKPIKIKERKTKPNITVKQISITEDPQPKKNPLQSKAASPKEHPRKLQQLPTKRDKQHIATPISNHQQKRNVLPRHSKPLNRESVASVIAEETEEVSSIGPNKSTSSLTSS